MVVCVYGRNEKLGRLLVSNLNICYIDIISLLYGDLPRPYGNTLRWGQCVDPGRIFEHAE